MPQVIGTNVLSLNAQRNLNSTGSSLATSLQRLSSGLRINSAKDDAAGLAISNRMTAQIRGLNQAARNSNDGISLAQTAEGDLAAVTTGLQRIRELAVQSANATNSSSDRQALQAEAAQLIAEIDRIAVASSFNGVKLLDGSFTSQQFQVGANSGQTINVSSIASSRTSDIGQGTSATTGAGTAVAAALGASDLTINGNAVAATSRDAAAIAAAINAADSSVTATATNSNAVAFTDASSANLAQASVLTTSAGATTFTTATSSAAAAVAEVFTTTSAVASDAAVYTASNDVQVNSNETFTATNTVAASLISGFDFSTDQVSFSVKVGAAGAETVTLNTDLVDESGFLAEINTQITEAATASIVGGKLVITADNPGAASALVVGSFDGDVDGGAGTVGDFVTGSITVDGRDDYDFSTQTVEMVFAIDGGGNQTITLDQAYGNEAAMLADINTDLAGNATASVVGNKLTITSATQGATSNVSLVSYNGDLNGGGEDITDFVTGTLVAGRDKYDFSGTNAVSFDVTVDGGAAQTVNLNADYDTTDATFLAAVNGQLNGVTATVNGSGQILFTSSSAGASSDVVVNNFNGNVDGIGRDITSFIGGSTTTAGAAAVTNNNFTLQLDGNTVLDTAAGVGTTVTTADISTALRSYMDGNADYTYTGTTLGTDLVITKADGTDINLAVTSTFAAGGVLGGTVSDTSGVTNGEATASDFGLSVDGVALDFTTVAANGTVTGTELADTINALDGYTATFAGGNVTITKADGSNVVLDETPATSGGLTAGDQTLYGSVTVTSTQGDIVVGGAAAANAGLTANTYSATTSGVTVANTDISTVTGANNAIVTIDNALDTINSSRGDLGAIQSRFESVVSSLSTTAENLSAARSRIQDADFAQETAALTKAQILQQAGISILAQANAQPQLVLSLLQ